MQSGYYKALLKVIPPLSLGPRSWSIYNLQSSAADPQAPHTITHEVLKGWSCPD